MLIRLIGGPYQGNESLTAFGVVTLGVSAALLWEARQERDPERKRGARILAVFFVLFAVSALVQVLTHPGAWREASDPSRSGAGVGVIPVALGLLLIVVAAPSLWWGWTSARWPTADGEVVQSTVREQPAKGGRTAYVPEVRYSYAVGGKSFTGRRLRFNLFGNIFGTPAAAYGALAGLVPGGRVTVFYNPRFPRLAVVRPGCTRRSLFVLAVGAVFVLTGLLGVGAPAA